VGELEERGVILLRSAFAREPLSVLRRAAERCLTDCDQAVLPRLLEFGLSEADLYAPLAVAGVDAVVAGLEVHREQCWVRKRYAPVLAPPRHHPNSWHQDGGLGVAFPAEPGAMPAMTPLVTCWIPLDPCGVDAPGLEFVTERLDELLHYTELADEKLKRRFAPEKFTAPPLEPGDGLIFLNGTLHRTHVAPRMSRNRRSVEYRFRPR
jgi:ectoine hydroxylase-related dioxygenase (phytanoyl-CoA dioxygenase family)